MGGWSDVAQVRRLSRVSSMFACGLWLLAPPAMSSCLPLPDAALQALDRGTDDAPEQAIREAHEWLVSTTRAPTPFERAQLFSILAEAHMQASQPEAARAAVVEAIRILDELPPTPDTLRVRQRVLITDADAEEESNDSVAAVKTLDALLSALPPKSLERACALNSRLEAHGELNEPDKAAADGLAAYQMAAEGGWTSARVGAAYGLANIYRQAGLLSDAERMIGEVVEYASRERRSAYLASAEFSLGHILIEERKFSQAIEALKVNRENSRRIGDPVGIAAANLTTCMAWVAQRDFDNARSACATGDDEFAAARRADLLALLHATRGEIAIGEGRTGEGLAELDTVLGPKQAQLAPVRLSQYYRDRAAIYNQLGRYREAYADTAHAYEFDQAASTAQRLRAVAVLSASAQNQKLLSDNRTLEQKIGRQREELSHQRVTRILWTCFSVVLALIAAALGYLLAKMVRQGRALRHQETIVRTVASHAPDALVLLGDTRLVRFCNRNLFGGSGLHPVGQPLEAGIPAAALPVLRTAIDEIFSKRGLVTCTVSLVDSTGTVRYFELTGGPAIEDGRLVGAVLRSIDVTALRRLEREVIDVSSRERQRLSGDLHEGLGQELTGVLLLARSVLSAIDRGRRVDREIVAEMAEHVSHSIETTREIARGLSPVRIERGSLGDAISRLADEAATHMGIRVVASTEPVDLEVSDVRADHLYRIVHEVLTTVARKADCRGVEIGLNGRGDELTLNIRCDGGGSGEALFDETGLRMMAYRARLLGGTIQCGATVDGGCALTVVVPRVQDVAQAADSEIA